MRCWLKLLDMGITPEMLRLSLTTTVDQDLAEALFRYYARKQSKSDVDRDKPTSSSPSLPQSPRPRPVGPARPPMDGVAPVPPFEIALMEILDDADLPELTPEESRISMNSSFLARRSSTSTTLTVSWTAASWPRPPASSTALRPAFYHPHALAVIAPYNHRFGRRFARALCHRHRPGQGLRPGRWTQRRAAVSPPG